MRFVLPFLSFIFIYLLLILNMEYKADRNRKSTMTDEKTVEKQCIKENYSWLECHNS